MRHSTGLYALAVCGIFSCAGIAAAQGRTPLGPPAEASRFDSLRLSRTSAISEALQHNAQLEIANEQTAQARGRRAQGIAIPDPQLAAAFDASPGPFTFGAAGSKPVSIGLNIPFFDKFRLNNRIGNADIHASESNYRLQQQTVALTASADYDSLILAYRHREILTDTRNLANDFLKRTQARFDAGTAAKLDVIQAQVSVAQAQTDLIANERDIAAAQASLNRTLGRVIGAPIVPTDTLSLPRELPDSNSIETNALRDRPELAILNNQRLGAAASTKLAKEFWLPDITFGVQRDYIAPGSASFTTGIALPLPTFYWQHSRGEIAIAQHFEKELSATYRDARAQVTQDVRTAYANASTAMRQVVFIRDQLVPGAREAYRVASTSYGLGGSSALEVLTARSTLLQAESQLADALASANTARADLDRALGLLPVASSNR